LECGGVLGRVAAGERGERRRADRQRPRAQQDVLETNGGAAEIAVRDLIERRGGAHAKKLARLAVVLQVLADTGELVAHVDAMLAQQRRWTNAGKLQDLRRPDRAGRDNHLAARVGAGQRLALPELDADRALAIEAYALDLRVRQHPQVGALRGWLEE